MIQAIGDSADMLVRRIARSASFMLPVVLASLAGCQSLRSSRESLVDKELSKPAPPAILQGEADHQQPREGFNQEPPKAQQP